MKWHHFYAVIRVPRLGSCSTLLVSTECSTLLRYDEADSILVGEQRGGVCFTDGDETNNDAERP